MRTKTSSRLSKMYWIGGSPCCGKSTLAQMLAREFSFELYKCDDHLNRCVDIGFARGITIMRKIRSMNLDETWLRDISEQVVDEIAFYGQAIGIIEEELANNYKDKNVVVEGAALIPGFIENRGIKKSHYVCMAPTKEFQIDKYSKRGWAKEFLAGCSDITKAFANWMERDARYAEIVVRSAKDYGMNVLIVDGSKSIKENYLTLKQSFHLG